MPRNETRLFERNAAIYSKYKMLYDVKFLRHEKVVEQLAKEFYLTPSSVTKIIINQKKVVQPAPKSV